MGLLYTKFKMFHFKDKLDSLPRDREITPPIHIRIKPTNVCNHDCWYCAYKVSHLQLGKDMVERDYIPKEKMLEILEDCKEMGVKAITFSGGGEPLVYKYMLDALRFLVQTDIAFATLTNGSRLNGEVAELFARHGTWVRVSMDGYDNASYKKFRGTGAKEFDKIIQNMESFKKIGGKCDLGVSYIVGQENYQAIYPFAKILRDVGVDSLKIAPTIVSNDSEGTNAYHQGIYDAVREQIARVKADFGAELEIFDSYHYQLQSFKKDYDWCPYSQMLMVIGADLNLYPCQDKAYNLEEALLGSIANMRFKDWWQSNKESFFKVNPCKVCNHHCVADDKNRMVLEYLNADAQHLGFV
ncbi:radical SAM/SPASM domain-containing protein [Helicobacter sp.]|uniref:radical SAM/SPASM domain-containing protein n=1 Tax=Helicobacter sp. TaxID=218 RepID=UPI0025BFB6C0|nr:radical SAM protein [Helicobacter sp.]MCI5968194.1 radical SAM protein [Helicobacter sp.]MDY2585002.1 radical SAM protein [Helicobacter sp.]